MIETGLSLVAQVAPIGPSTDLSLELRACVCGLYSFINDWVYRRYLRRIRGYLPPEAKSAVGEYLQSPAAESVNTVLRLVRLTQLTIEMVARKKLPAHQVDNVILAIELFTAFLKFCLLAIHGSHTVADYLPARPPVEFLSRLPQPDLSQDAEYHSYSPSPFASSPQSSHKNTLLHQIFSSSSSSSSSPTSSSSSILTTFFTLIRSPSFQYYAGEVLYILRGVVFVLARRYWGEKSWIPWLLALLVDLGSRLAKGELERGSAEQRNILAQRTPSLLWYLLRLPMGQKTTDFIDQTLGKVTPSFLMGHLKSTLSLYTSYHFYTSRT